MAFPKRSRVLPLALLAALVAGPAVAGPPLLCEPFDTAGAPTLPWGGARWNQPAPDYAIAGLPAHLDRLLAVDVPVVARMETLRRAAIYASRDGGVLARVLAGMEARIAATAGTPAEALALFDAGYFRETLQDVARLQGYDMPGIGAVDSAALAAAIDAPDGHLRIAEALERRPGDAGMAFASAVVAAADERDGDLARHAKAARAAAPRDALVALNVARLPD